MLGTGLAHPPVLPSAATVTSARSHQRATRLVKVTAGGLLISDGQNPRLGTAQWPVHGSKSTDTAYAGTSPGPQHTSFICSPARHLAHLQQHSCGDSPSTGGKRGRVAN